MRRLFLLSRVSPLALALGLLSGCAVGPDFVSPVAPDVSAYDYVSTPEVTADGAQALKRGGNIPSQWWKLFRSSHLNKLIVQALLDNPDLASAEASLRVAEDNLSAGGGAFFPTAKGSFSSQRTQVSKVATGATSVYNLHNASIDVSYNLDLWGGTRRSVEQLQALVDVARFQKEAAHLALTSNVVTLAITEASLREQIAAAKAIIKAQTKTLEIVQLRFNVGAVDKSAVMAQKSSLAAAKASLPALDHQLVVARHALAALVGQTPEKKLAAEFRLSELTLPKEIPLSLPSKLVAQRPDVRAAEANLHAASAAIGVAVAARLPSFLLSADIGSMAKVFSSLFAPGGGFWSIGGSAVETLFDGGALADKEQAARDTYKVAAAQYRKTVLTAFQNVADALHALQSDAESLVAKREVEKAAAETLVLTKAQFEAGAVGMAELLLAEQAVSQARAGLAQASAQRYADTAALFAALGGGWWNRDLDQATSSKNSSKKGV